MITNSKKGFTVLELLIVIAIIAILSVVLIVALNPAETLRKTRDSQRISDLSSLKTALGIYVTTITDPLLDNTSGNTLCVGGSGDDSIWISVPTATDGETLTGAPAGTPPTGFVFVQTASNAAASGISGSGWVPVNLAGVTGGSPISNMPLDPINDLSITTGGTTASTAGAVTNSAQMYRYSCAVTNVVFELNARLESTAFGVGGTDDKAAKDGGNNANLFEVGTSLTILPNTNDF